VSPLDRLQIDLAARSISCRLTVRSLPVLGLSRTKRSSTDKTSKG